ncbi:RNA 2',3'-cyclic phosphodiesterase [Thermodesulfobacteriota bacterium]
MYRLFIAIDLPETIKKNLEAMFFGIPGARWAALDQLHLTVRFIGEVDGALYHDIKKGLEPVSIAPFDLQLKGVGHFPPRGAPRVIWVGLEKSEPLQLLRNKIDTALVKVGVEPEGRKFSPHITLARLKNTPLNKVTNFLAGNGLFRQDPFKVEDFMLYSSTLTRKGAIHSVERIYSLY